eukprot:UN10746
MNHNNNPPGSVAIPIAHTPTQQNQYHQPQQQQTPNLFMNNNNSQQQQQHHKQPLLNGLSPAQQQQVAATIDLPPLPPPTIDQNNGVIAEEKPHNPYNHRIFNRTLCYVIVNFILAFVACTFCVNYADPASYPIDKGGKIVENEDAIALGTAALWVFIICGTEMLTSVVWWGIEIIKYPVLSYNWFTLVKNIQSGTLPRQKETKALCNLRLIGYIILLFINLFTLISTIMWAYNFSLMVLPDLPHDKTDTDEDAYLFGFALLFICSIIKIVTLSFYIKESSIRKQYFKEATELAIQQRLQQHQLQPQPSQQHPSSSLMPYSPLHPQQQSTVFYGSSNNEYNNNNNNNQQSTRPTDNTQSSEVIMNPYTQQNYPAYSSQTAYPAAPTNTYQPSARY